MADEETESEKVQEAPKAPGVMIWSVAGGLAIFIGVLGAQVAAPILSQMLMSDPAASEEEMDPAMDGEDASGDVSFASLEPAIYVPLEPPMLGSFEAADGSTRYLQMSIQAMGRDQSAMDAVRQHAPAIRNSFLFLMSMHSYEDVATVEGKEQLRAEMLVAAQEILKLNTGDPGVEEIYFTSMVLQ